MRDLRDALFFRRDHVAIAAKAQSLIHHYTTNNGSIWVKISGVGSGDDVLRLLTGCTQNFVVVVDVC